MSCANSTPTGSCAVCGKKILPALGTVIDGKTYHLGCAPPRWTPEALGDTARQSLSTLMIRAAVNAELADGHAQDAKFILSLIERAHVAGQAIDRDKLAAAWAHAKRARDAADVALGSLARMGIE